MPKQKTITRDISWLAFNHRVLQEAADDTVPLKERIKFLGIFSNNLDEFFRVRVATLRRMAELGRKTRHMHLEADPGLILEQIQDKVLAQQQEFDDTWKAILREMKKQKIFLLNEQQLNRVQRKFVVNYFDEEIRSNIVPLMIESIHQFPTLSDKSIYLACTLRKKDQSIPQRFALVSVPARRLPRFVLLPSRQGEQHIILLEDIIRYCLPFIFSFFNYDDFSSHIIKVTRDAEMDIDNDISTSIIQKIEKGLRNRKKGRPVRFIYDKDIDPHLLTYLVRRLGLTEKDNIIPGGRIHNFKDFMNFPDIFAQKSLRKKPFLHPLLKNFRRVTDVVLQRDVMLHFPYHAFDSVIDLLREAAIDPEVTQIKITCYRLASRSKIINALTNAVRNGKQVTVVLELRARFDEEANLMWKEELEEAGVKVLIGLPHMKIHAKLCLIKKITEGKTVHYGFVSTGNLNESTARIYGDHCLLTSDRFIMADVNRIFHYLEQPKTRIKFLKACKTLLVSPVQMRQQLLNLVEKEIRAARAGKPAAITLKVNSLSDPQLIGKLGDAARAGVELKMVIRGICCMPTESSKYKLPVQAISIVDEYLEHARVMIFHNGGNEKTYISSADWMVRNIDHRVEAACPIPDPEIALELREILQIQLADNIKARKLDNSLSNQYLNPRNTRKVRSQVETYQYLARKLST